MIFQSEYRLKVETWSQGQLLVVYHGFFSVMCDLNLLKLEANNTK